KINTSVDKVGNIHAIEFTVKGKRYDIIISAKGNVGINSIVDGKSTMLTKPNTAELDNIMLSSILKDKLYNINFDNFKTFNSTSGKLEYDAKKATNLIKELIDNGDLLSNVGMVMDEKGNKISNFVPEGKRNMIITIGDEIKDNFEETSKVITKPPVGEKEDVTPKASTNPFDDALNEIQQKGKTLLQKELTIEQNKKVSENVLKIVADKLSKRTNIPYYIVNYEDIKDKYEDVESTTKGFYAPGEKAIYFIRGNFTLETAFHEFAHPIVDSILTKNRILFRDLSAELQSDKYKDSFAEVIKKYAFDYKFDTTVTQEQLNDYNVEDTFKFFNTLPRDIRIKLLSEGITNAWGQESATWIDETTGKIKVNLAEVNPLVRLWQMIVDWFKEFIGTGKVEDIKPTTTIRELGQMLALGDNDIQIEGIDRDAIKYTLKSIDILNSDKAKQIFEKGNKNNWSIDKILQELAIPKEQKQLVIDSYNEGNKTPEQLAINIASKYSYSVEVKTATIENSDKAIKYEPKYKMLPYSVYDTETGMSIKSFATEQEAKNYINSPSKHYSNLSAPGDKGRNKYEGNPDWEY
ncbi:MAG TPA: hypothetical protein PLC53_03740, partial [Bacilli bacterium]|nr:hypothetical protein [Bacilli bacterium]